MLADDDQAPSTATNSRSRSGADAFVTTRWSVVREAQGTSPAADAALERLCRTYWRPIHAFVRRQGSSPEEAQDLTQGFFARLLERRDLDSVRQEKGRLRSYLLVSLKHFLFNERKRARTIKRGEGQRPIALQELGDNGWDGAEPMITWTAEQIFEHRWALTLLDQVLVELRDEYEAAGNLGLFGRFSEILTDEPGHPSQADIGDEFGMTENAVKQAFHRFRQRYRALLRDEVARTVTAPGDIEDELRHLIAILQA